MKISFGWVWRFVRWLLRMILCMLFIMYLASAGMMAWTWVKKQWYTATLETPQAIVEKVIQLSDKGAFADAIFVYHHANKDLQIQSRPLLEEYSARLVPHIFFIFARESFQQGDDIQGLNWAQYARFRMRYDVLRCKTTRLEQASDLIADIVTAGDVTRSLHQDPSRLNQSLAWVLEYDAKHPAVNNPAGACRAFAGLMGEAGDSIVDPEDWPMIRQELRTLTQTFLDSQERKKAQGQ